MDLSRRHFFSASALAGYSVIVDARRVMAQDTPRAIHNQTDRFFDQIAPEQQQHTAPHEPNMTLVNLSYDVLVAGGGMSGVCAAIAAARHGAKVLLVQDRSRLGGNASSEIKMHIVGADKHGGRPGWREGGLIEEFRLEDAVHNPHRAWELWDLMLYDKCISEPNLDVLLDSTLYAAQTTGSKIDHVLVRCDKAEHIYQIKAHIYMDCTGDSRLALEAGADYRVGREDALEFAENLGLEEADSRTQGSSILFTAQEHDRQMPFIAPNWARKLTKDDFVHRGLGSSWEYGYWWIELGGMYDTIRDNEQLRFELLSVVLGVWDYIKNSGEFPSAKNWALQTVGMIPGKRESRRIMGDYILTQVDLEGAWKTFDDGVAIGGWNLDDHPPEGFDAPQQKPYTSIAVPEVYNIPLGSLYSRNIGNLMMAGRNISCSHVAFTSTRVMATCSVIGQAAGTAAAICARESLLPKQLRADKETLATLQQMLLRDDQSIRLIKNQDPDDLARSATVKASGVFKDALPEHVINGEVRDMPDSWDNRWAAPLTTDGAWIELQWSKPQHISHVQITFDSGFQRELTLSASNWVTQRVVRAPQPETVKNYQLVGQLANGTQKTLVQVKDNYQRLCRHDFDPVDLVALKLQILSTNGAAEARVYEIRCYS